LTKKLLAFGRKGLLVPTVIDLNEMLSDMKQLLTPLVGEEIQIETRWERNLSRVRVDPDELGRVVMNLVVNARDAMPDGGTLVLETANVRFDEPRHDAEPGDYVMLAVHDTGHGMDAETRARLFEPFFTTKSPEKGTGLGLAMVYGVIRQSGGCIEVSSELGKGSCFRIFLPRHRGAATPLRSSVHVQRPPLRGSETILLAEDEPGVRKFAQLVLSRAGYRVIEAKDGVESLECADREPGEIQLLITDVVMPGMSGPQLVERLRNRRSRLKVLYLSGYTNDAVIRRGIREGEAHFLQKPFSPDAITGKVREILDQGA
jgi:CheY-like chemotaxis protein